MHLTAILVSIILTSSAKAQLGGKGDAADLVDELLQTLNNKINQKHLNAFALPTVIDDGFFFKKVFSNGTLLDFGTIVRKGNASIVRNLQEEVVNFVVQSKVGLKSLKVDTDYLLTTFFGLLKYNGHISVEAKNNMVDVEVTVVTHNALRTCTIVVNDLAVEALSDFSVNISNAGLMKFVMEKAVEYVIRYVLPAVKENINEELHEFIRTYPINPEITQYVCKYFLPQ